MAGAAQEGAVGVARKKTQGKARGRPCPDTGTCAVARERDALRRQVKELQKENAGLKARVETERRKLFKANKAKDDVPEDAVAAGSAAKGKKKRGAPVGHPGWHRPIPAKADRTVEVAAPDECPHCGGTGLEPTGETVERLQEDIVLVPRPVVTRIALHAAWCPHCRRKVTRPADEMLPQSQIGPVAQAVCVYLRHDIRLSLGKVRQVMKGLFGLAFVPATALRFGQKAARNGAALYEEILNAVRTAAMANADETGIHVDGINYWVWLACTANLAVFRIDASRSGDAAVALLGEKFNGTLVADDYAAYNRISALFRQSCLAHPIRIARDLAAELERSPLQYRRTQAIAFCNDVKTLLCDACDAHTRLKSPAARLRVKASYTLQLRALCASPAACDRVETFRNRLLRTLPTLFTFLSVPGVPPTNNAAERALRPIVIFRKTSFGIRSDIGAKDLAVMSSLLLSVRLQQGDPLAFTRDLVANNLHKARRAIFPDTS